MPAIEMESQETRQEWEHLRNPWRFWLALLVKKAP
jgi:hypothetical protein